MRIRSAVITLVTLAAGTGSSFPELAMKPRPDTPIAAEPPAGQGSVGGVPLVVVSAGNDGLAAIAGIGRR